MVFWRKKNNTGEQERQEQEDKLAHNPNEPALEPLEDTASLTPEFVHKNLQETAQEIIDELSITPTPIHTPIEDVYEAKELADHESEGGWLSRLSAGLSKSTNRLGAGISDIFTKRKLDEDTLQELEDLLISADLGPKTASLVISSFSSQKFDKNPDEKMVCVALAGIVGEILTPVAVPLTIQKPQKGPYVLLICGVNGAGKTTTIGKLAYDWHIKQNKKVMIAAADTFRAAAVDQLDIWAKRAHVPLFKKDIGADAAAVAFEAYEQARAEDVEILMIDTAGRLQNKSNLMAELEKIVRVLKKQDPDIPHSVLLVLDATTGQNAHSQVKIFKEAVNLTGLIVTKLDGSSRGGVVISLAQEFGIPIHAVGVGEKIEDLSPFDANDFAKALMGVS